MLMIALGAAAPGAHAETRVALVIGNAGYAAQPLRNPRRDAELMAATLKGVGFEVILAADANARAMREAVTEFSRRIRQPNTVALFYYAGHGVQLNGENYLVPVGASIADMAEVAINAVALSDVMKLLGAARTRLNIVILDACRDNPFAAGGRGFVQGGLAPAVAPSGTVIGYATAPGQIARDGAGANSPYTAALAFHIPRPGTTLEEVFRDTRRAVIAATGGEQVPWEHSSLIGAFYFKDKISVAETSAGRLDSGSTDMRLAEVEAWEKIKAATDPDVFKEHLARFPDGLFAELAALKRAKLEGERPSTRWSWTLTTGSIARGGQEEAAETFAQAMKLESEARSEGDWREVAALHLKAAQSGFAQAMVEAARAYDKGRGVPRDVRQAAHWYGEAAERQHAGAMAALGTMYEFGEGVPLNLAEALRLYRLSADAGDAAGLTSLAYLLAEGKGAAQNAREARRLYRLAAAKGHPRAQYNLALMELSGAGGRREVEAAVERLESAAGKGHVGSNEELAQLYDQGRVVRRSPQRAATYILAAIDGAAREGRSLDIFRRRWSQATRRELQRLTGERAGRAAFRHSQAGRTVTRILLQAGAASP